MIVDAFTNTYEILQKIICLPPITLLVTTLEPRRFDALLIDNADDAVLFWGIHFKHIRL